MPESVKQRAARVLHLAEELARQKKTWLEANRALFSPDGLATILFPTKKDRDQLVASKEYATIESILETLEIYEKEDDASGKFVVRIPKSLHAALKQEAETENVSLNQLAVAKLSCELRTVVR